MAKESISELKARIAQLEAQIETSGDSGRIWPDVSKACKNGDVATSIMVLRGVHANPRNTVNVYPSQFARMLRQLPDIVGSMLKPALWNKFTFRNSEEKAATHAFLVAYHSELTGGSE